ncbi:MAG: GTPase HflX [Candidatus Acetothermia bacterium]|jgi:GTP-binding protein HflX|nr:GTPase HflX [Candidatus Acetothermia bacterium]
MGGKRTLIPAIEDYLGRRARVYGQERAILADVLSPQPEVDPDERMAELAALARTARVAVMAQLVQRRARPDPATFLGRGKAGEIRSLAAEVGADTLIVGAAISPAQARNLEEATRLKVVDRSQLILDIFAQRAGTKEAALAVELAQLEYLLPRLRGWGQALTDPGGGIGTRGPGETRLEQGRRAVRRRIQAIRGELARAHQARDIRRRRRRKAGPPEVVIVGYTNSGKSTLFNQLTQSDVLVEDKLFATLDTRVRRVPLPGGGVVVVTDTVGFIRDLPHQLVPAFHATLESVHDADLLLLVLDASSPSAPDHLRVVRRVIAKEILRPGEPHPPILHVLNKIDLVESEAQQARLAALQLEAIPHICISAKTGDNVSALKRAVAALLAGQAVARAHPGR